jgi:hypothetical protein
MATELSASENTAPLVVSSSAAVLAAVVAIVVFKVVSPLPALFAGSRVLGLAWLLLLGLTGIPAVSPPPLVSSRLMVPQSGRHLDDPGRHTPVDRVDVILFTPVKRY